MKYAEILLPYALDPLTYDAAGLPLSEGMAVAVRLGPRKVCQGIVWRLHERKPHFPTRSVIKILYGKQLLSEQQMRHWEWVSDYYMCPLGEVMAAAMPSSLRPTGFSDEEFARGQFSLPTTRYLALHPDLAEAEALNAAFDALGRAKRQYEALVDIAGLTHGIPGGIPRAAVNAAPNVLAALEKRGFITSEERLCENDLPENIEALPGLTAAQAAAAESIRTAWKEKPVVLLHGVTGSGKTEIFIHMAAEEIARGRNVLYLLPEIPVSYQLVERLRGVFGERLAAYHSKAGERQRASAFLSACDDGAPARLITGTRGAALLPLRNLGLVIVDEEHDASFKQDSPAPRFHARDTSLMLASMLGARALLGSATPSMESFYNASTGKYGLVELTERYGGAPMPAVTISDSLKAARRGERQSHFNALLINKISSAIKVGSQAILFQNRRGFSPWVECGSCGWTAHCPDCNVTLTLHKAEGRLRCHYCGHCRPAPRLCPSCGQGELLPKGYGTEKIEDEISAIFPDAAIGRLDSDTASSPRAARRIITDFERGRTDILVGAQMVTKGFDFPGVTLVGVISADAILNYPDFRAAERAFQMLTQAAGRAGRRAVQGEVIIQTSRPDHPVLAMVAAGDYRSMARAELAERRAFLYPPYCRIVSLTLRCADKSLLDRAATALREALHPIFGNRLLGPQPPAVDRVGGENILIFTLKIEQGKSFAKARKLLAAQTDRIRKEPAYKKVALIINVDPQ